MILKLRGWWLKMYRALWHLSWTLDICYHRRMYHLDNHNLRPLHRDNICDSSHTFLFARRKSLGSCYLDNIHTNGHKDHNNPNLKNVYFIVKIIIVCKIHYLKFWKFLIMYWINYFVKRQKPVIVRELPFIIIVNLDLIQSFRRKLQS